MKPATDFYPITLKPKDMIGYLHADTLGLVAATIGAGEYELTADQIDTKKTLLLGTGVFLSSNKELVVLLDNQIIGAGKPKNYLMVELPSTAAGSYKTAVINPKFFGAGGQAAA